MARETNWTIANLLTISRVLLTPGFVIAFQNNRFDLAWILFGVAGLTDALDGMLARILKQKSRFGAMLDPLADKILLVTSFICLSLQGWLPQWFVILVVSRDVIIVGGLGVLNFWGVEIKDRIDPIWTSKMTTVAQISLVLFVMFQKTFELDYPLIQSGVVVLTAILTILSGAYYLRKGVALIPDNEEH